MSVKAIRLPIILALLVIGAAALLIIQSHLHQTEQEMMQSELDDLNNQSGALRQERERLLRLIAESEDRMNLQSDQQNNMTEVVAELRVRLQDLNDEYRALLQTFEANQQRLNNAQLRLQELMNADSERDQHELKLAILTAQVSELDVENTGLRSTLTDYRNLAQNTHSTLQTERSQRQQLELALQQEQHALTFLQNQLDNFGSEQEYLIEQMADGTTIIKLPERILFEPGSATLNTQAQSVLAEIARAIASFPQYTIAVQGHSDSIPVVASVRLFPTNWELSSARASAAVRELIDQGIEPTRLKATGFADTRPLVEEFDDASRRENRRIEVVLEPPLDVIELDVR